MRDWEGREATRSSRKSGNLACCNGKRPHQLREKSKWRQSKQALQLSSLDALDLPMEIGGVFVFSHKKAQKAHKLFVWKEGQIHEKNFCFDLAGRSEHCNDPGTDRKWCNQWLHKGSARGERAGCDGQALWTRSHLQSRNGDRRERCVQLQESRAR